MASDNLVSFKVSAPAKIILHGEHSVVYGKTAIAASLNLRTYVAFQEEQSADCIRFFSSSIDLDTTFDLESVKNLIGKAKNFTWFCPLQIDHDKLLNLITGFLENQNHFCDFNKNQKNSLLAFFYLFVGIISSTSLQLQPFTIKISSDLTLNSGSGSSASYAVAIAASFLQYLRLKMNENYPSGTLKSSQDAPKYQFEIKEFNNEERKLIADWSWLAERIIHGSSSGLDPTICTMGSLIKFRKNEDRKLIETLNVLNGLRIFLVDTSIPRDIKLLVGKVKSLLQERPEFVRYSFEKMDDLALKAYDLISEIDSKKYNLYPSEDSAKMYQELAVIIKKNHVFLKDLGVSHPSLDKICEIAASYYLPAKLTGAGGGGFAYILLSPNTKLENEDNLVEELKQSGFKVSNITICGPGVTID